MATGHTETVTSTRSDLLHRGEESFRPTAWPIGFGQCATVSNALVRLKT